MVWILSIAFVTLAVGLGIVFLLTNRTNGKITSSGRVRRYLLYVPETYDESVPTPLVICIHGFVQWPAHQQTLSGWNSLADEHGFIVVYPQGTGFPLRWNTYTLDGNPDPMQEEVQFFLDLIESISKNYNIDPSRIYANGMSNGGGMSHVLACALSTRIAAIGCVAGAYLFGWECCQPERSVPVIAFHGTKDSIVPYEGGPSSLRSHSMDFRPVEEWAANWARHNGCDDEPERIPRIGDVRGVRYSNAEQDVEAVLYTVEGGGHTWPGGDEIPRWIAGHTNHDVCATELMWAFFSKYALPR